MKKITSGTARTLAEKHLHLLFGPSTDVVIMDQRTRAEDFGWVYFYQSKAFLETRDWKVMLVGNSPLIVDFSGRVYETGTALPIEDYIDGFRAALKSA